jgi:thiol-disulfide isomerase/thioredoxin
MMTASHPPALGSSIILLLAAASPAEPGEPSLPAREVTLQVVKYRELGAAVRAHQGKVVVVDLWADWCGPCKEAFPHLVELHEKYASQGLVCISVSLDLVKDRDKVVKFLREKRAAFPNYLLDEEQQFWQEKFDINGPPSLFIFNRDHRRAAKFDHNDPNVTYTHRDVERVVRQLLGLSP